MLLHPALRQLVIIHLLAISHALVQIVPSSRSYGPDGPWQTVNVTLGSPPQFVQLLPGGIWASTVLSDELCRDNTGGQLCGSGGLYDPLESETVDEQTLRIQLPDPGSLDGGQSPANVSWRQIMETLQLPRDKYAPLVVKNFSIKLVESFSMDSPDGSPGWPPQVGNLALGAPDLVHVFANSDGTPKANASLLPAAIYQAGDISSNSFGLHIGSVAMGIPLSLWLGGYDSSRVLGSVSSQPYTGDQFLIDLLEVGLGVDNGASPFPFPQKQDVLREGNDTIGDSVQVSLEPLAPYLHLPQSTCDAIASYLPVSYQSKYNLYFWNTTDPLYEPLVRSPSFLSFTFRAPSLPEAKLTIKVPFQLLNLTLQAPMIDTPTQYFPCRSPAFGTHPSAYALGRAFLQAAFLAVKWDPNNGQWSLSQAPGPDTARAPQQEQFSNTFKSSTALWSDSWKGHWTPIEETISTVNSTNSTITTEVAPPKTGLSTGAKAGIGVGCAAAAVGLVAGICLCVYRSRSRARKPYEVHSQQAADAKRNEDEKLRRADVPPLVEAADPEPVEMSHREMFQELPTTPSHQEMFQEMFQELSASPSPREMFQELPATPPPPPPPPPKSR
ncbi:MAG: hypothetical protein Q9169_006754 [Polycauliona sp. 2 TL-2023]